MDKEKEAMERLREICQHPSNWICGTPYVQEREEKEDVKDEG